MDALTVQEYLWLLEGRKRQQIDEEYKLHAQAYLNLEVTATESGGEKYYYDSFVKFFDYENAMREAMGLRPEQHKPATVADRIIEYRERRKAEYDK